MNDPYYDLARFWSCVLLEYFGKPYNHGTPFHHAAIEGLVDTSHSIHIGIREGLYGPEDSVHSKELGYECLNAHVMHQMSMEDVVGKIKERVGDKKVFLTFDIDFLDPAYAPGTGTPVPGGFSTAQALELVRGLKDLDIIGYDMVEVSPPYDPTQATAIAAAGIMQEFLSHIAYRKEKTVLFSLIESVFPVWYNSLIRNEYGFIVFGGLRMKEISFWEKDAGKISSIIEVFDRLSDNSYIWVTNLKEHQTWCTEKTKNLFDLFDQLFSDFEHMIVKFAHPRDVEEYLEGIDKRLHGIDLDDELCIRFHDKHGKYSLFSFHMERLCDENDIPEYLVVVMNNENIFRELDAVTDLYSEAKYVRDLEKIIAQGEKFALLQVHVEGFSTFNLVYGRDYANELLHEIALAFIYMMDFDKAVYRLERERFVFLLKKAGRKELLEFEQQVRDVLSAGIIADGKRHSLKMGAGAILIEDYHGDASSICGQLTYALNHSVRKHQDQLIIFNDEVKTSRGVDFELMKVIHQSVRNQCEGFYVEYQPIVDSNTGTVEGAEALVRWCREPYGKVPPGMFIEWMETDPSMYDLGNFVLRTALSETRNILFFKPDFFINVNVSIKQLERREFRGEVLKILKDTGFPADHLCLELTERCKDFPLDTLYQEVQFFQSCGIRVAMDDYGTGSASSNIVMNIPMDEIKIDMSFIRGIMDNPKNQAMVHSILDFANKSNMKTCLEGVENEELQNYLRKYNATWFQGYYYSKPVSVCELEKQLESEDDLTE